MKPLLKISNASKAYRSHEKPFHRFSDVMFGTDFGTKKIILDSIDFELTEGESVGILGVNGAGKSTLLKLVCGIITPTHGSVVLTGTYGALLELGLGFNPEYTGRQNALMAAQLLGLSRDYVLSNMDEIINFSGVSDYIDAPVKVYSSGMLVRLAFSVATLRRPDLLIVDEALSVGDAVFQRKCFQRIQSYLERGTALLFVSHSLEAIKKFCERAIYLENGRIAAKGSVREVCDFYEKQVLGGGGVLSAVESSDSPKAETRVLEAISNRDLSSISSHYGTGDVSIRDIAIRNPSGEIIDAAHAGSTATFTYTVVAHQNIANPIVSMMLKSIEGQALFGTDSEKLICINKLEEGAEVSVSFELHLNLAPGAYTFNCGVRCMDHPNFLMRYIDCVMLEVIPSEATTVKVGVTELCAQINIEHV